MKNANEDNQNPAPRKAGEEDAPLRHKGEPRTPEAEKKEPLPEGNGATGKPAAFPEHN